MRGQHLARRFIELAEEALAFFSGNLLEKMSSWCLFVFSKSSNSESRNKLKVKAQKQAGFILQQSLKWLENKEKHDEIILLSNHLEVILNEPEIWVGDSQLGYLAINAITSVVRMEERFTMYPISPTVISLYKYVTWDTLEKILKNGTMAASAPRKCNDVYEFMPAWKTEEQHAKIFEIMQGCNILMLCLSRTPSSSVMWGHYAKDGTGALLRFEIPVYKLISGTKEEESMLVAAVDENDLKNKVTQGIRPLYISQVTYKEERCTFETKKTYYEYDQMFASKGKDWAYEQEMRIIFNNDDLGATPENGLYLTPILMPFLTEIVLGPRCNKTDLDVYHLMGKAFEEYKTIPISKTEYSSRFFKLNVPVPEGVGIDSITLYRRIGLCIPAKYRKS